MIQQKSYFRTDYTKPNICSIVPFVTFYQYDTWYPSSFCVLCHPIQLSFIIYNCITKILTNSICSSNG